MVQNGMATSTNNKLTENGSYGINANWTIWDGGVNRKNIEAKKVQTEQAEVQTDLSLKTIQEQIAQLYVQILYTTEAKKVNDNVVDHRQQQRKHTAKEEHLRRQIHGDITTGVQFKEEDHDADGHRRAADEDQARQEIRVVEFIP